MTGRAILHVDMDAFFASVEQRDDPALRGRPVVVGGSGGRGVVAAASYEARAYGIHSAMPAGRARRLCPGALFVRARHDHYRAVSGEIFAIFRSVTPLVEGLSLDEAYLDATAIAGLHGGIEAVGRLLKRRIAAETGLTASVGMASTRLVAKLASDYDKPDGFVHVPDGQVRRFLDPLPVRRLPGVGPSTAQRLNDAGILTLGQLRSAPADLLQSMFGDRGHSLAALAAGEDPRPVTSTRVRKSVSQESTFDQDMKMVEQIIPVIAEQALKVSRRMAARGYYGRTVHLKLRSGGFSTLTRSRSLDGYTRSPAHIADAAEAMLRDWARFQSAISIRLVGVGVSGLETRPDPAELL